MDTNNVLDSLMENRSHPSSIASNTAPVLDDAIFTEMAKAKSEAAKKLSVKSKPAKPPSPAKPPTLVKPAAKNSTKPAKLTVKPARPSSTALLVSRQSGDKSGNSSPYDTLREPFESSFEWKDEQ